MNPDPILHPFQHRTDPTAQFLQRFAHGRNLVQATEKLATYTDDQAGVVASSVDVAAMSATFVISTSAQDRVGDVVLSHGCLKTIGNYARNPRIFFDHQQDPVPIGSARRKDGSLALDVQDDRVLSTCFFHGKTPLSEQLFALVVAGELEAASIGFTPLVVDKLQGKTNTTTKMLPGYLISEWDLLEWSIVGVPMNQEATRLRMAKGIDGRQLCPELRARFEPFAGAKAVWTRGYRIKEDGEMSKRKKFRPFTTPPPATKTNGTHAVDVFVGIPPVESLGSVTHGWSGPAVGGHVVKSPQGMAESSTSDGGATVESKDTQGTDTQAVHCPKSLFTTADEAKRWCELYEYTADRMTETDAEYVFEQFPLGQCVDEPKEYELEGGCTATVCQQNIEPTGGSGATTEEVPTSGKSVLLSDLKAMFQELISTKTACQCQAKGANMTTATAEKVKMEQARDDADGPQDGEKLPPGVKYLKAMKSVMDTHAPNQEHPAMKSFHEKCYKAAATVAAKAYPEHDLGFETTGEETEDDQESQADGDKTNEDEADEAAAKKAYEAAERAEEERARKLEAWERQLQLATGRVD